MCGHHCNTDDLVQVKVGAAPKAAIGMLSNLEKRFRNQFLGPGGGARGKEPALPVLGLLSEESLASGGVMRS